MTRYKVTPELQLFTMAMNPGEAKNRIQQIMIAVNNLLGSEECLTWKNPIKRKANVEECNF